MNTSQRYAPEQVSVNLDQLIASPNNPNVMTAEAFNALREAIRVRGYLQPILVVNTSPLARGPYRIVDGHHRVRAMMELGYSGAVAMCLPYGTPREVIEMLQLGMNRLRGQVSLASAEDILRDLMSEGVAMDELLTTGFSEEEMNHLLGAADDPDVAASAPSGADDALPAKPFAFELTFATKREMQLAKRGLRKAAGKTKDLALGLLNLLDADKA